ncbi:insulin-degrading enzyme, partial [Dimargaris cristalligena]
MSSPNSPLSPPPGYKLDHIATGQPYFTYTGVLEQSVSDDNQYRLIELPNQLRAVIIQAPADDAIQSSAALNVRVGDFADPPKLQGLAHYCEHLLFMGTDKYPEENEYSQYLSSHGGYSNAYTDMNHTNYHFTVNSEYFEGALDRFAQFFISPLFSDNCKDRELKAVDSEHKKNLQNDSWREFQVNKSVTDPSHPFSNFATGDLKTLKEIPESLGINVRDELLKFYDAYYSANLMQLVVYGRDSLDHLTEWVVSKFSPIANKDRPTPYSPSSPWKPEHLGRTIRIEPVQTIRTLTILFPTPDFKPHYECNPTYFLSCLIGHEGAGSLTSHLKKQGWITTLSASGALADAIGFDAFDVTVSLTPEGLEHTEDIIAALFSFIQLLHQGGPQEDYFNQVRAMSQVEFRYSSKIHSQTFCTQLSSTIGYPWFRPEHYLSGYSVIRDYRPDQIRELLGYLNPDNFLQILLAKDLELPNTQVEPHYGAKYALVPFSPAFKDRLHAIAQPDPVFHLPSPNPFIPKNFTVSRQEDCPRILKPTLLKMDGAHRLWFKPDDRFWLPRGTILVRLLNNLAGSNPFHSVRMELLIHLFVDHMNEMLYDASEAGISVSLLQRAEGLVFHVTGFQDKLQLILERVLRELQSFAPTLNRFDIFKENAIRELKRFQFASALSHANAESIQLTHQHYWSNSDRLRAAQDMTLEQLIAFKHELLVRLAPEVLVYGNYHEEQALAIQQSCHDILGTMPFFGSEMPQVRSVDLPRGQRLVRQRGHPNANEKNAAIIMVIPLGMESNPNLRACAQLLADIMEEPFFNQLRTKESLGYLVNCGEVFRSSGLITLEFSIQSERSPVYLQCRILTFLRTMLQQIVTMKSEKFEKHREALIKRKQVPPKSMYDEARNLWERISDYTWEFDYRLRDIEALRQLDFSTMVAFAERYLDHSAPQFTSMAVHI